MTTTPTSLVRIRTPHEYAATVPHLLGHVPHDDIVLCLRQGTRHVVAGRIDIPDEPDPQWLVAILSSFADVVARHDIDGALVLGVSDDLRVSEPVGLLTAALDALLDGPTIGMVVARDAHGVLRSHVLGDDEAPRFDWGNAEMVLHGNAPARSRDEHLSRFRHDPTWSLEDHLRMSPTATAAMFGPLWTRILSGDPGVPLDQPNVILHAARSLQDVDNRDALLSWAANVDEFRVDDLRGLDLPQPDKPGERVRARDIVLTIAQRCPAELSPNVWAVVAALTWLMGDARGALTACETGLAVDESHGLLRLITHTCELNVRPPR